MSENPLSASQMDSIVPEPEGAAGRRRFLITAVGVAGAAAVGLFADILVQNMSPGRAVAAEGAPVDVDISKIEPGQLLMVAWKKKPVWILRRETWMLNILDDPALRRRLRDPDSKAAQQPAQQFINGNYRALRPHLFVAVALCTHMQCIPDYRPTRHTVTPWWFGGFHCPCHGSIYDLSGRVFEGSPAPLNIPIPPYYWKSESVVRIGETDPGGKYEDWTPSIW